MHYFAAVFVRNFRTTWTMPIWVLLSLVYPVLWLVLFGTLFSGLGTGWVDSDYDYFSFFAGGMLASTTVFGALWAGVSIMVDRDNGVLRRVLISPASKLSIAAGYVSQSLTALLLQVLVILAIAAALGAQLAWDAMSVATMVGATLLLGVVLSGLSHALAMVIQRQEGLIGLINFLSLPILFLSSVLFPIAATPAWFRAMAFVNPVHHAAELIRHFGLPGYAAASWTFSLIFLLISAAVFLALSSVAIRRR